MTKIFAAIFRRLPFALCVLLSSHARAGLTWPATTVELHADAKAAVLEARFPFTNDGAAPVDIREVQTDCGCTTAALAQRHFEPGQRGEIVARYTVGDGVGVQRKTILVFADGQPLPTTLTLVVHLPEWLRVRPGSVVWTLGEPGTARDIVLEAADGAPLRDVSVQSSNPAMRAELQPPPADREGSQYQLRVTPADTHRPVFATLTIRARFDGQEKMFHAFASVQPASPAMGKPPVTAGE